jgi:hypothetical protein
MKIFFSMIVGVFVLGMGGDADSIQEHYEGCGKPGLEKFLKCSLPVVPGIMGFGVRTPAGSGPNRIGGSIIHVTNLNASGKGSLREAIDAKGPRIVIFDVSGYIDITMDSEIRVKNPYLTIAGQTAPSPGISLKGNGLSIRTHDVLVQHIRIRVGDNPAGERGSQRDGLEIVDHPAGSGTTYNVVVDHVSVSWGLDENMSVIQGAKNITISNSINSEALDSPLHPKDGHSYGLLYGGPVQDISTIGSLFAHNNGRNPRGHGGQSTVFINNVVYNWGKQSSSYGGANLGPIQASIISNVFIRGLDTTRLWSFHLHDPTSPESKFYLADNLTADTSSPKTDDPWLNMHHSKKAPKEVQVKAETPPSPLPDPLTIESSSTIQTSVLTHAGARPADRDLVDTRIIANVKNVTGNIIVSQDDVGGWPILIENFIKATPPNNPWTIQPSGYNKLEEWLHVLSNAVQN